jgi:STE24 endopeptidase
MTSVANIVLLLILAKAAAELALNRLNRRQVMAHAGRVPAVFREFIDEETYRKVFQYTLAKGRFGAIEDLCGSLLLLTVLFSGVLPWAFAKHTAHFGHSVLSMAGFLFLTTMGLSLASLPFDGYSQFRLEARFGFNNTSARLWWLDRLKGFLLGFAIGVPLLTLLLKLVDWSGSHWWLYGWACLTLFQVVMSVLAPILILPLFNQFSPLPDGSLKDRLMALAERTHFRAGVIQIMDGSKRSTHSNAFFTGLGRFRKIVLFDTLIQQLSELELEAVLAHEIGHYRKRHIPKSFLVSSASTLAGFYALSWLGQQSWLYPAFGFSPGPIAPAFLLFGLLAGTISFWISPLMNFWLRRHEYQADAFAAQSVGDARPLITALRKLSEKNLSNLTPHPLYSRFYYSHPTLVEREQALKSHML